MVAEVFLQETGSGQALLVCAGLINEEISQETGREQVLLVSAGLTNEGIRLTAEAAALHLPPPGRRRAPRQSFASAVPVLVW